MSQHYLWNHPISQSRSNANRRTIGRCVRNSTIVPVAGSLALWRYNITRGNRSPTNQQHASCSARSCNQWNTATVTLWETLRNKIRKPVTECRLNENEIIIGSHVIWGEWANATKNRHIFARKPLFTASANDRFTAAVSRLWESLLTHTVCAYHKRVLDFSPNVNQQRTNTHGSNKTHDHAEGVTCGKKCKYI